MAKPKVTREEVLKWRNLSTIRSALRVVSESEVENIIDCYESLLSRCVPWLERNATAGMNINGDAPFCNACGTEAVRTLDGRGWWEARHSEDCMLDTLLAEITEVKR